MATLKYLSQYFSTTLNVGGGIDASQTTGIILQSVSGVHDITEPGQICITYSDPIDTSVAEWIDYTSINGSNELVGAVRGREGFSAHTHLQGATVVFVMSASHHNDVVDLLNGTESGIKVKTALYDENGNEVIKTPATTSAVNEITVTNSATGNAVQVSATGGDTDISLNLVSKGAGTVQANGTAVSTAVKASGAEITTGTDDAKFATAKALADAGVNTRLKSKVKQISRDLTATGGQVSYTGIGFTPSAIISMAGLGADITSIGVSDSAKGGLLLSGGPTWATNTGAVGANLGLYSSSGGNYQTWNVYSYDADGFTLTWSKTGSPTGTLYISFLCFG